MKKFCFRLAQRASFMAVALLLTAVTARAADDAPPAVPAPSPALAPAPAQDANPPGGRGNRGNNNNNFQRGNVGGGGGAGLNFDDKQRELLQESRQTHNDDLRKLNEKLAEAQKEYVKAVVAEKLDEKVVREKADALGKIQADILALNGKSFAVVSPTLKPEQRESLEGNVRIGIVIISPTTGFGGGPGGNFAAPTGAGGAGGGRRGGGTGGPGGAAGIGGGNGGPGGNNADQPRRRGGNGGTAPGQ